MTWRIRAAAANGGVYFTSDNGILKSASASADMSLAGLPQCLDLALSLSSAGTPTLLANGYRRAYRGSWCLRDANNNLIQGAPSARFDISNGAGATRDVSIAVQIPTEITRNHFFQLCSTTIVATAIDPGDEQRVTVEYYPTAADIAAGSLTIVDITPDSFRGADLYTNASQEGAANANDRPPLARDIAFYQGKMLYANFTDLHEMKHQLLGTTGMVAGQTLTLGGVAYTVAAAEAVATGSFLLYTAGTQSVNVETTAKSLCKVINQYPANTSLWAYYESGVDDPPGRIRLVERAIGGSTFYATCSATAIGNLFSPAIPTSGTTYASVADRRVNQIRVAKEGEPEHAPKHRNIVVGGEDEEIQRIIPLRTSLIVIKDRSIWRLVDADPEYAEPVFLDNTCSIAGRDSAAVLNNTVFMLSNQGFVCITDNGVQIVGRPIENQVLAGLEADDAPNHDRYVGCGHESRRQYICTAYQAGNARQICYVYSPIANQGRGAWTTRNINANAFAVLDDRLMYGLKNAYGHVLRQRSSRRDGVSWYYDYGDEAATFTVTSEDTAAKTITGTLSGNVNYDTYDATMGALGYGWKFYNGNEQFLVLSATGSNPYTLTLAYATEVGPATWTLYRPVVWKVEYAPIAADSTIKRFGDVQIRAETSNAYALNVQYENEMGQKTDAANVNYTASTTETTVYVPPYSGAEPSSTQNDFISGSDIAPKNFVPYNTIRTSVAPTRSMGQQLLVRIRGWAAHGYVAIKGLAVNVEPTGSIKGRK